MSYVAPGVSSARLANIERALWVEKDRADYSKAGKGIARVQAINAAAPITMDAGEGEIRAMAERRAELMMDRIAAANLDACPVAVRDWINAQVKRMQGRPLRLPRDAEPYQQRRGLIGRVTDKAYWVKSLRKAVVSMREAHGRARAHVSAKRQQYITDDTMRRTMNQDASNRAMLESTFLENEDGQEFALSVLSDKSTSNPAIRRGELMTRIRGCEELAESMGLAGIFTTQTTPSRFHAVHRESGAINERWIEAGKPTPKDGQQWLCKAWQRARAELDRHGLGLFGFRVAEPHHDGTPHWHGLFWVKPEHVEAVEHVLRWYWLNDQMEIHGPFKRGRKDWQGAKVIASHWQPGRAEHGLKTKRLEKGGAAAYIAKYIAKGIDDAGAVGLEGHDDELDGRTVRMEQGDMFGGGAARVSAWARAHGIRQFQPLGQPPVTAWRELRRVSEVQALMSSERVHAMWQAAQRKGAERASWARYVVRQGGPMCGRQYRVAVDTEAVEVEGKYETFTKQKPVGVIDRVEGKRAASDRKEWRPRGAWGSRVGNSAYGAKAKREQAEIDGRANGPTPEGSRAGVVHPWTRVNNCTGRHLETVGDRPVWQVKKQSGRLMTWAEVVRQSVKGSILETKDERPSHGRSFGAHRLPDMRHPQGDADHP